MRHTGAGLAIPDFPLMFGHLLPTHWDPKIAIHFSHRLGALVVVLGIVATFTSAWSRRRDRRGFAGPAALLIALVVVQVTLGALTVLSQRDVWINSFHVVCGALVLTTSLVLTLRTWREEFPDETVRLKADATPVVTAVSGFSRTVEPAREGSRRLRAFGASASLAEARSTHARAQAQRTPFRCLCRSAGRRRVWPTTWRSPSRG